MFNILPSKLNITLNLPNIFKLSTIKTDMTTIQNFIIL